MVASFRITCRIACRRHRRFLGLNRQDRAVQSQGGFCNPKRQRAGRENEAIMSASGSNPESHPAALAALVALIEKSVQGMDQKLGYHGQDRFVLFYYEPRGEEV